MTEKYTPEKVAELVERLRQIAESQRMDFDSPHVGMTLDESADALTAISADVEMWKQETGDAKAYAVLVEADRDRLHKAITEALELHQPKKVWESDRAYTLICAHCELRAYPCESARILRAALDQEGNDDE